MFNERLDLRVEFALFSDCHDLLEEFTLFFDCLDLLIEFALFSGHLDLLVEFALFSGRLDILKRGFVDNSLVKFVRSLKTQKFSDRLYPSKRILFEILKGSVENVVDSILAAELGFISTLVVEERSVLDLARYKSFEVVGQVSREIVEFESAFVRRGRRQKMAINFGFDFIIYSIPRTSVQFGGFE